MAEMDEYKQLFLNELNEYVESLNTLVLDLEKDGSNIALAEEVMRIVHSIKGMAAVMEYQSLADITHELESLLSSEIESGKVSSDLIGPLFIYIDKLQEFAQLLEVGDDIASVDMGDLLEQVANLEALRLNLGKRLEILVKFDPQTQMKNVRAFMVLQNLEAISKVLSSNPTKERLEAGAVFEELSIEVMTKEDEEVVRNNILAATDVIGVSINYFSTGIEEETEEETRAITSREIQTVRVSLKDLDEVMNLLGELMILRGSISTIIDKSIGGQADSLARIDNLIFEIQEKILSMRMVSLEHILSRFPRVIRDLAYTEGKKIDLQMIGKHIELDRSVIDPLNEILLHLVRNAASHGIESPEERITNGKPEVGSVRIIARQERDGVQVDVEDDGSGIDMDSIRQKAVEMGLAEANQTLSRAELTRFIFSSGFSTLDESDKVSGRGYGLNIVSRRLDEISGSITIRTKKDVGTNFTIKLPLTIAIQQALLVEVSRQKFALPLNNVQTVLLVEKDKVIQQANRRAIVLRGELIPVIKLGHALRLGNVEYTYSDELADKEIVVVWEKGVTKLGLIVENLLGQRDIVIKQLDALTSTVRGFSGASIIDEGEIVLILDPQAISDAYA
ncbi:MAG: chemotaxis protein CheA [Candidatus Hodarchaeales archaeon]|jgi:two-component system chemotaxis sensor kinase CheA